MPRPTSAEPLLTAVATALVCRWLGFFAGSKLETIPAFVYAVYGIPLFYTLASIWFIATGRTFELPVAWVERLYAVIRGVADRMVFLRLRSGRAAGETA